MGRNLTRWLIPLPAILLTFFPDRVNADATYNTWTCQTGSGSWQMQQPEADYLAGLYPTWADCLNWQNGTPPEPYTWSYGASVTTTTTSTTTTTTSTSTNSTTTSSTTTLLETTTSASTTTLLQESSTTTEPIQTTTTNQTTTTSTTPATTTTTTVLPAPPTQTTSTTDQPVAVPTSSVSSLPLSVVPVTGTETTTTETTSETTMTTTSLQATTTTLKEVETSPQDTSTTVAETTTTIEIIEIVTTTSSTAVEASESTLPNETETTLPLPQDDDSEASNAILEPVILPDTDETGEISPEVFNQILDEIADAEPAQVVATVEAILETKVGQEQAIELVTTSEVLAAVTEEQAEQIFEQITPEELSETEAEAITEVVQNAPNKVRNAFEKVINIFGSQFESYVPTGSNIPVSQRRSLVAIGGLLTMLPAPVRIKQ